MRGAGAISFCAGRGAPGAQELIACLAVRLLADGASPACARSVRRETVRGWRFSVVAPAFFGAATRSRRMRTPRG